MDLASVESQRTGLIQTLVFMNMLFMGLIVLLSWRSGGYLIPALALVSLLGCLYLVSRERKLKQLHHHLVEEVNRRGMKVRYLDRKLKEEEDRTTGVRQLHRALTRIHSQASASRIYDTTLEVAIEMVGGDCGSILLLDDKDDRLHFYRAQGLAEGAVEMTLGKGQGMAGWVIENGEPLLLVDGREMDPRLKDPVSKRIESHIAMALPIPIEGRNRGVLCLGSRDPVALSQFTPESLRWAYMLAQYASAAIELAGLRHKVKTQSPAMQPVAG